MTLQNETILCLAPHYWEASWLDVQRYMHLLAEAGNRVLVVDRPLTPLSLIVPGQRAYALRGYRRWWRGTVRTVSDNLQVLTPAPILPLRYEPPVLYLNTRIRRAWLTRTLRRLQINSDDLIVWVYEPDVAAAIRHLRSRATVYVVTDDYASSPHRFNRQSQIRRQHERMIRLADLVIASETHLAAAARSLNPETYYVPHGVEYDIFSRALQIDTPDALPVLPEPVIGFVGRIDRRMDMAIMRALRQAFPHGTLLLVGPIADDSVGAAIGRDPAFMVVGLQPVEALPAYLKAMTVCIIPYVVNEHTRHLHPLKALEYLAAGRPVVSTRLPALTIHDEHIRFADTPAAFVGAVQAALETDTPEKRRARSLYTQDKTWAHRLDTISTYLDRVMRR